MILNLVSGHVFLGRLGAGSAAVSEVFRMQLPLNFAANFPGYHHIEA